MSAVKDKRQSERKKKHGGVKSKSISEIHVTINDSPDDENSNDVFNNSYDTWTCGQCQMSTAEDDVKMMECDFCFDKHCLPCIKMTDIEYQAFQNLKNRDDSFWLCPGCVVKVKKSGKHENAHELEQIKSEMTERFSKLENQLKGLSENIATTADNNKTEIKQSFAQAVIGNKNKANPEAQSKVQETGIIGVMNDIVTQQRKAQNQELSEKEEREKNIMIFRHKECEEEDIEVRKSKDKELLNKLLQHIGCSDIEVKGMFRVGKFDSDKNKGNKPRPLKICLYNKNERDSLMRNLFKLKDSSDTELKTIQIGYDMSSDERNQYKIKVEEAKQKTTDQDFYVVRGPPWALRVVKSNRRPS